MRRAESDDRNLSDGVTRLFATAAGFARVVVVGVLAAVGVGVGVVGGGGGCTNFPREDRVEDTRVLAIKTEPAEILYSPLFLTPASQRPPGFPLPSVDVNV